MNKNNVVVLLFKMATIIHIICLLANLCCYSLIENNIILYNLIEYSLLFSIIGICIATSIKAVQYFIKNHNYFVTHHKIPAFFVESCIAVVIITLLFINQEITGKFIIFMNKLSNQAHNNQIIALMIFIGIILCIELYESHKINKASMESSAIKTNIRINVTTIGLKGFIIITTAIGYFQPLVQTFQALKIKEFDSIIFNFTTTEFFLYIHTIIIILFLLWIAIGIYWIYKKYTN